MLRSLFASLTVVAAATAGALLPVTPGETPSRPAAVDEPASPERPPSRPLDGKVIVVDPGHQLGNANFTSEINAPVDVGGWSKPCNTTGTATYDGYPEATFTWQVARVLQARLRALGADVVMTRRSNRDDRWGPCVDARGRKGNAIGADLKISIHGDGSYSGRGFHVIAPVADHRAHKPSKRLAVAMRRALRERGLPVADYIAGGDGLDFRDDLGTINLSRMPVVMVELGNMRASEDAARMTTPRGRATYAAALTRGVRAFLR